MSPDGARSSRSGRDLAPISGVVGVALFLIGSLLPGGAPRPDASSHEVVSFLVNQRSLILLGSALTLLSIPFGLLMLTAIAWRGAGQIDASIVRFGYDTSSLALYAVSAPAATLAVGAPSVLALRTRLVPRWVAVLGVVVVTVNLVEVFGLTAHRGLDAGGYAAGIGPLVWATWVIAFAVGLVCPARPD